MGRYREGWTTAATAMVVVGLFLACGAWSVGGVLTVALSVAVLLWMVSAVLGAESARTSTARRAGWALLTGGGFVALIGWTMFVGAFAVVMWSVLVVSSPLALGCMRVGLGRWRRNETSRLEGRLTPLPEHLRSDPAAPTTVDHDSTPEELHSWDLCELCWAWRRSYVVLQRATTVNEQLKTVQLRQHLLDELDRRDPEQLSAWLASGARAAGNPSRYIVGKPTDNN